jgi:SAM-dependent methyltransferase
MSVNEYTYVGTELELFAIAKNWKNYINILTRKYIKGNVLEVGAGIGSNTGLLCRSYHNNWLSLEPDTKLFQVLESFINSRRLTNCSAQNGTIDILTKNQLFDAILYLDVLEHIREDQKEIINASEHLKAEGYLIILAPAHQWLYTPFDAAIGHHRRYNKQIFRKILPTSIEVTKLIYLDSFGLLASLANKLILKQSQPTLQQISLWDKLMIPASKRLDKIINYQFGKSILLIGRKK